MVVAQTKEHGKLLTENFDGDQAACPLLISFDEAVLRRLWRKDNVFLFRVMQKFNIRFVNDIGLGKNVYHSIIFALFVNFFSALLSAYVVHKFVSVSMVMFLDSFLFPYGYVLIFMVVSFVLGFSIRKKLVIFPFVSSFYNNDKNDARQRFASISFKYFMCKESFIFFFLFALLFYVHNMDMDFFVLFIVLICSVFLSFRAGSILGTKVFVSKASKGPTFFRFISSVYVKLFAFVIGFFISFIIVLFLQHTWSSISSIRDFLSDEAWQYVVYGVKNDFVTMVKEYVYFSIDVSYVLKYVLVVFVLFVGLVNSMHYAVEFSDKFLVEDSIILKKWILFIVPHNSVYSKVFFRKLYDNGWILGRKFWSVFFPDSESLFFLGFFLGFSFLSNDVWFRSTVLVAPLLMASHTHVSNILYEMWSIFDFRYENSKVHILFSSFSVQKFIVLNTVRKTILCRLVVLPMLMYCVLVFFFACLMDMDIWQFLLIFATVFVSFLSAPLFQLFMHPILLLEPMKERTSEEDDDSSIMKMQEKFQGLVRTFAIVVPLFIIVFFVLAQPYVTHIFFVFFLSLLPVWELIILLLVMYIEKKLLGYFWQKKFDFRIGA
ncbi:MAG: hypothetical protein J6M18_03380 [Actinomycetaceae bacterium]|nr:hypothetical protein [Actinomycetaceae bacterium]